GNVLLHHFDPLQGGCGDADFPRKVGEGLTATPRLEEIGKILPQTSTHGDMVRQLPSHMWDKSLLYRCIFPLSASGEDWLGNSTRATRTSGRPAKVAWCAS